MLADLVLITKNIPDPEQQATLLSVCARVELTGAIEVLELLVSEFNNIESLEEARLAVAGLLEEIRYLANMEFLAKDHALILRLLLDVARKKAQSGKAKP